MTHVVVYTYEFSVWPREGIWEPAVYQVFRHFLRVARDATKQEFDEIRD